MDDTSMEKWHSFTSGRPEREVRAKVPPVLGHQGQQVLCGTVRLLKSCNYIVLIRRPIRYMTTPSCLFDILQVELLLQGWQPVA